MSGSTELARNGISESACSSAVLNAARHGMSLERGAEHQYMIHDTRVEEKELLEDGQFCWC
jgi:hypothetical protein